MEASTTAGAPAPDRQTLETYTRSNTLPCPEQPTCTTSPLSPACPPRWLVAPTKLTRQRLRRSLSTAASRRAVACRSCSELLCWREEARACNSSRNRMHGGCYLAALSGSALRSACARVAGRQKSSVSGQKGFAGRQAAPETELAMPAGFIIDSTPHEWAGSAGRTSGNGHLS